MKELYENLDLEVIRFRTEDVIATSEATPVTPGETIEADNPNYSPYTKGWVAGSDGNTYRTDIYSDGAGHYFVNQDGKWVEVDTENIEDQVIDSPANPWYVVG